MPATKKKKTTPPRRKPSPKTAPKSAALDAFDRKAKKIPFHVADGSYGPHDPAVHAGLPSADRRISARQAADRAALDLLTSAGEARTTAAQARAVGARDEVAEARAWILDEAIGAIAQERHARRVERAAL